MLIADKHDDCGDGPVILEDAPRGFAATGWRAICCACWMHGPTKPDRKAAIEAWTDKSARREWHRASLVRQWIPKQS